MPPDVCGNGVLEPAHLEDCDLRPDPAHGESVTCNASCRYSCDPRAAAPACPAGWGCGGDGVCRHGTGRFDVGAPLGLAADFLAASDLDGSGAARVLGSASEPGRFQILSALGTPRVEYSRTAPGGQLAGGDLDGDGLGDLIRPAGNCAIAAARGQGGAIAAMLAGIPRIVTPDDGARIGLTGDAGAGTLLAVAAAPCTGPICAWGVFVPDGRDTESPLSAFGSVRSRAAIGRFVPDGPRYQSAFVVDGGALQILVGDGRRFHVALGGSATSAVDPYAMRLDATRDVVIVPGTNQQVAWTGSTFAATPIGAPAPVLAIVRRADELHYVGATAIVRMIAGQPEELLRLPGTVAQAVALDANGDGEQDVAWYGDDASVTIAFWDAADRRYRRLSTRSTSACPIVRLHRARFGGLTDDLAVIEDCGSSAFVQLITDARPEPGEFDFADFALPVPLKLLDEAVGDLRGNGADDLLLLGVHPDDPTAAMSAVVTVDNGELVSQLKLDPGRCAAGFGLAQLDDAGAARDDLVTISTAAPDVSTLRAFVDSGPILIQIAEAAKAAIPRAPWAIADLDGDGIDELVVDTGAATAVYRLPSSRTAAAAPAGLDLGLGAGSPAAPDAIAAIRAGARDCVATASAAGVVVRCLGAPPIALASPEHAVVALVAANVDGDPADELVVVSGQDVGIHDMATDQTARLGAVELAGASGSAVAADLDGDGVVDLAIGTAAGDAIVILWGVPHDRGWR